MLLRIAKLASNCNTFEIPGVDVEICCSDWFGGLLFFEGMPGEQFLVSFEEVMVSGHEIQHVGKLRSPPMAFSRMTH